MERKEIYNPTSKETIPERRIFGGNSDGMINFTKMKYEWALRLWDTMEANTWFPKEVGMTGDAKDYRNLNEAEKRMYDLVLSQLIFMDSLQANNLMDNINPYITAPEVNACLSRQSYEECLVGETEVLTPFGWKRLDSLTLEDKVLQVDINQNSNFVFPDRIVSHNVNGTINKFSGRGFSQIVTDGHRMLYRDRKGTNKERLATDFKDGIVSYEFLGATYKNNGRNNLSFYERFLIALQADGSILIDNNDGKNKNRNGRKTNCISVTFSFSKERKIKRMQYLLENLGFSYTQKKYDKELFTIKVPMENIITKSFKDWVNLEDISGNWAKEFILELKEWDGWDYNNISFGYDTTNKDNMDMVEMIGCLSGTRSSRYIKEDNRKKEYKDLERITFKRNYDYISRGTITKEKIQFKGNVYCLTVPNGFFLVKHNGYISVTGNCNHSKSYAVMVESISDNTDEIYQMWKTDKKLREKNDYIAKIYKDLSGDITDEKILIALIANQILEGLYFYAGFAAMYALGKSGKMLGSSQMIRFIQRDEVTHLLLFQNMINSCRIERPDLFTPALEEKVRNMFREAVILESNWGKYITQGQILGFTDQIILQYIQYLADKRLAAIGYKAEFNVKHPIPWVDGYASFNEQRTNFFEGNVVNYSKGSLESTEEDFEF